MTRLVTLFKKRW